jgi:N-methylhydantoinase A
MKSIIVEQGCGVLSSKGLLIADLKSDFSRAMLLRPPYDDLSDLGEAFSELQTRAREWLAAESIHHDGQQVRRFVSLRYENQGYELDVPWDSEEISSEALEGVFEAFHNDHQRLYSFYQKDAHRIDRCACQCCRSACQIAALQARRADERRRRDSRDP